MGKHRLHWWDWCYFGLLVLACIVAATGADASNRTPDVDARAAQDQVQTQDQTQSLGQEQTAEGGVSTASGTGGSARIDGDETSVVVRTRRNAPGVSLYGVPPTADMMVCIGFGGSNTSGAATGFHCRLQRDLYAAHRSGELRALGLEDAAAEAYCDRPLHWRDFGSKAKCIELYAAAIKPPEVTEDPKPEPLADAAYGTAGGEIAAIDPEVLRRLEALEASDRKRTERERKPRPVAKQKAPPPVVDKAAIERLIERHRAIEATKRG